MIIEKLSELVSPENFFQDEPMKKHTTFRAGGLAEVYLTPKAEQIPAVLRLCREEELAVTVIGNGSNLLVSDKGITGVVIEMGKNLGELQVSGNSIKAGSGVMLAALARAAATAGLTGLEFASGIPGTVGGAVVMNAGAYDGEIKNVIKSAKVLTKSGEILELSGDELELSYRHSCIPEKQYLVLEAEFVLTDGDTKEIQDKMEDFKNRRITKQPLEYPSAGSTFKRPEGYFAGKLIMDAGLAGYRVGGAMVSEKHCGFVINYDQATATDIYKLICDVKSIVKEKSGVELEPEVKLIGEF